MESCGESGDRAIDGERALKKSQKRVDSLGGLETLGGLAALATVIRGCAKKFMSCTRNDGGIPESRITKNLKKRL